MPLCIHCASTCMQSLFIEMEKKMGIIAGMGIRVHEEFGHPNEYSLSGCGNIGSDQEWDN